jgi:hypothetical protein
MITNLCGGKRWRPNFKKLSCDFLAGLQKTNGNLIQGSQCPERDANLDPDESKVLSFEPTSSDRHLFLRTMFGTSDHEAGCNAQQHSSPLNLPSAWFNLLANW